MPFVVDRKGKITWSFINIDYKQRAEPTHCYRESSQTILRPNDQYAVAFELISS